jgi:hypothetical protein
MSAVLLVTGVLFVCVFVFRQLTHYLDFMSIAARPDKPTGAKTAKAEAARSEITRAKVTRTEAAGAKAARYMISATRAYMMKLGFIFKTAYGTNLNYYTTAYFINFKFFIEFSYTFWWFTTMMHRSIFITTLHTCNLLYAF